MIKLQKLLKEMAASGDYLEVGTENDVRFGDNRMTPHRQEQEYCEECGAQMYEEKMCNECGWMEEGFDRDKLKKGLKNFGRKAKSIGSSMIGLPTYDHTDDKTGEWKKDKLGKDYDMYDYSNKQGADIDDMEEALKGGQKKLDVAPPFDKITGADFKKLRGMKKETVNHEDHEVSMARNSLRSIISSASQLMNLMGEEEKDIPAWIQDHITNAENYINQASKNYHEYSSEEMPKERPLQSMAERKKQYIKQK